MESNFNHSRSHSDNALDRASDLPAGAIAEIVLAAVARTCLSCGAKEAADGSLPCNH